MTLYWVPWILCLQDCRIWLGTTKSSLWLIYESRAIITFLQASSTYFSIVFVMENMIILWEKDALVIMLQPWLKHGNSHFYGHSKWYQYTDIFHWSEPFITLVWAFCVSRLILKAPEAIKETTDSYSKWVFKASNDAHWNIKYGRFEHVLMAPLNLIEKICNFMKTWGSIQIWILYVKLLPCGHYPSTRHKRYNKWTCDVEKNDPAIVWRNFDGHHSDIVRSLAICRSGQRREEGETSRNEETRRNL